MRPMLLEVCAYHIESCIAAQRAGAHRIELCSAPGSGGLTPSYGLIRYVLDHIGLPVYPIIRPTGGGFVYSQAETAIMKADILMCRELGCRGISVGAALPDGSLDADAFQRIMDWAGPMGVTCHKVFDETPELPAALEQLVGWGVERVLTSGGKPNAVQGAETIAALVKQAAGRIAVMPGGGVRSGNIAHLVATTGAVEYHTSAIVGPDDISNESELTSILRILAQ